MQEVSDGMGHRTVFVSIANRMIAMGSEIDALARIHAAIQRGAPALESAHRAWWHGYYPASFVTIPDARIESFYWIQLYKMASATRENTPVVDLMGPWFKTSVWAAYWQNLNTQLSYYTVHITNHPEFGEALCRLLETHLDDLINNVPEEYRHDSAALGNPTGVYDLKAPAPGPVREKLGTGAYQFIALPWLMQHFYLQYRYTMDDARLRNSIYPLLRRTFNTYLHLLDRDSEGIYHIPMAFSDEYDIAEDTSMNIALLRKRGQTIVLTH
jgi:alpha-L-fucosidase 2